MRKTVIIAAASLVAALQFAGCGSGSSVTIPQQKTAKIVFSASTSAALSVPVRTITIIANIPAGVSVPLNADGTLVFSTPKSTASLGGSYIPPLLTITLADTTPSGLGVNNVGAFAEIVVSYPSGSSLTEANFTGLNNPFPGFAATGLSGTPPALSTETLTGVLKPSMKVTF